MNITPAELLAQYEHANHQWPVIAATETQHHLPRFLLFACGSRESNLTNENGDGGHGRGIFQLDDRSHTIPADFATNIAEQARVAASMLASNIAYYHGSVQPACAAYNCGIGNANAGIHNHGSCDYWTTGRDYGADVVGRMHWLQQHFLPHPAPAPRLLYLVGTDPKRWMHGPDVEALQTALDRHGEHIKVDGWFGPGTNTALRDFQHRAGLHVDGICGPATRAKLGI